MSVKVRADSNCFFLSTNPHSHVIFPSSSSSNFVYAKSRRTGSTTQAKLLQAIKDLEEQLKQYVQ